VQIQHPATLSLQSFLRRNARARPDTHRIKTVQSTATGAINLFDFQATTDLAFF
jgi:hypothetical protein